MQIAPTRSTAFDLNRSKKTTGQRNSNEPFSFLWPCLLKVHLSLHSIWVIYCKELFGNIDLDRSLKYVQQIREILKPTIVWSSFDQARMRVSNLHHSEVFYMRQLWVYNFGIHDCVSDVGHMCMFGEHTAKRDANAVASCLHTYLTEYRSGAR